MRSFVSKALIVLAFFTILTLPVIASDKAGGAISQNENRYLAKFPAIFKDNNKINPGLKNDFEAWLKDNLVGRKPAQKIKAFIDFRVFSVSPSPLVHLGKDGWLFYTGDRNVEIGLGQEKLTNDHLMAIRNNQEAIQKALKEQGIDYVLVLVPSKASVYPEFIGSNHYVGETLIDQVAEYLQENTTITVINLKPDLVAAKKQGDLYFHTDTHWNHTGSYIGYKTIIHKLNNLGMIKTPPVDIITKPETFNGDLSFMIGSPGLIPPDHYQASVIQNPRASSISDNTKNSQVNALLAEYGIKQECITYINTSAEKKVLIIGDSYFFAWQIPQLFAENFAEMNFIRTEIVVGDIIQLVDPDVVIFERTERYLYSLTNPAAIKMDAPQAGHLSAEIISQNIPPTMESGKTYDIAVVVKNTGNQSWSEDDQIRLGIFPEGKESGYRVFLPEGVTVEPGQDYAFELKNYQASGIASTYIEFQMLQEGFQYFGEKERVDFLVK